MKITLLKWTLRQNVLRQNAGSKPVAPKRRRQNVTYRSLYILYIGYMVYTVYMC